MGERGRERRTLSKCIEIVVTIVLVVEGEVVSRVGLVGLGLGLVLGRPAGDAALFSQRPTLTRGPPLEAMSIRSLGILG